MRRWSRKIVILFYLFEKAFLWPNATVRVVEQMDYREIELFHLGEIPFVHKYVISEEVRSKFASEISGELIECIFGTQITEGEVRR